MERVLEAIRETQVDLAETSAHLTVSVGGSYVSHGIPVTPEQLLAAADQALYEAKTAGRDRASTPRSAADI